VFVTVGGVEIVRYLPLVRDRFHRDDVVRAGVRGTLHLVDPDATDTHHDHRLTELRIAAVDRRTQPVPTPPSNRHATSSGISSGFLTPLR
jgi:hypothetical protein